MSHNTNGGSDPAQKTGQQSRDALRHQQDAAHHKVHKSPPPAAADTRNGQQSQGSSQKDDTAINESEPGQQPEIPKVGSRDAPGG
jgi:hypothetical protein